MSSFWERQQLGRLPLRTRERVPVRIYYRGRRSGGPGPDFRAAAFRAGGRERRGDVELHIETSEWQRHGHDRDPAYNNVALHVVLDDDGAETRRADGQTVPVVALRRYLSARPVAAPGSANPCREAGERALTIELTRLGTLRLRQKAARYTAALAWTSSDQVLYAGLLEALGYRHNRAPMRALAERLPWELLEGEAVRLALTRVGLAPTDRIGWLAEALLAAAGLTTGAATVRREARGRLAARSGSQLPAALDEIRWVRASLRPANWPERRLAAAARILAPSVAGDLTGDLLEPLEAEAPERAGIALEQLLLARAAGQLGVMRAREIVVNVLLPLADALSGMAGNRRLSEAALTAFLELPATAPNEHTRHVLMETERLATVAPRAVQQQGLLAVFHGWCGEHHCAACPLGRGLVGR
ncbi:MAG: DUF2851 family protein [Chloroflexi bacterium]|nr:DUF2851 family protein [Chloroflexota bacterium]